METQTEIPQLLAAFTAAILAEVRKGHEQMMLSLLGQAIGPPKRGPGRPRKVSPLSAQIDRAVATVAAPKVAKPRRKAPKQLCPVPRCRSVAAPIFGMVCAKHKDVPKAQIKKFRAARAAKKAK